MRPRADSSTAAFSHRPPSVHHVPLRWHRSPLGARRNQHRPRASAAHRGAHGVWRYLGQGRFGVTIWDLFYDVNTAQPLRYNKLRLEVTLADDRDSASVRAIVETIDLQGVVVGSRTGSANMVRIPFEPFE